MLTDKTRKIKAMWNHRGACRVCACLREQAHGEAVCGYSQNRGRGRKGGSNLAATLVNSILCWPDAAQLKPGRDV